MIMTFLRITEQARRGDPEWWEMRSTLPQQEKKTRAEKKKVRECVVLMVVKQQRGCLLISFFWFFFFTICTVVRFSCFSLQRGCAGTWKRQRAHASFCDCEVSVREKWERNTLYGRRGGFCSPDTGDRSEVVNARQKRWKPAVPRFFPLGSNVIFESTCSDKMCPPQYRFPNLAALKHNQPQHLLSWQACWVNSLICGYADKGGMA